MTGQQRALALAVAALVAAGLVAVAVLDRDTPSSAQPDGPTEATPTSAAGSPDTVPASAPTTAAGATAPSATAWRAPKPGAYRYHASRTGPGAYERDGEMVVATDGPQGYTQSREQEATRSTQAYRVDRGALHQTAFTVSSPSGTSTCSWDKPIAVLSAKTDPGTEWSSSSACRLALRAGDADIKVQLAWRVVGIVQSKVGDATVPLLRVDGTSRTETKTDKGTIVKISAIVTYFDLAKGLAAQSTEDATEQAPDGTTTTYRIVETMLTVEPEVPKQ